MLLNKVVYGDCPMLLIKMVYQRLSNAFLIKLIIGDCPMLLFLSGFGDCPNVFK